MKILLLGEASFVHSTLRKGFSELDHDVILMSDGNKRNNCPRDIDLRRNMGYVIQQTGLFPHMTIKENIEIIAKTEKSL